MKQEVPSSSDDEAMDLMTIKPKRKAGVGKGDKKITISLSGMMAQVMAGQERVEKKINRLEEKVEAIGQKIDKKIAGQPSSDIIGEDKDDDDGEESSSLSGTYYNSFYLFICRFKHK